MKSLVAKNTHGVRTEKRGLTRKEKLLAVNRQKWIAVGDAYAREISPKTGEPRGEDAGRRLTEALIWSEQDYVYGCTFLFGVTPLDWQAEAYGYMRRHRLTIERTPNGGGKTVGFGLQKLYRGFFRADADPLWGQYRMFHFAPVEAQALETKIKIDEWLGGRAREQAYIDDNGHVAFRKCFAARFIKPTKFDDHEGYSFFNGSATLEFVPTAFMGMSKDGTDPMEIDLDEARHERNLLHLVTRIWIPRFLRTPGARLNIKYTPLDASPELEAIMDDAQSGRSRWHGFVPKGGVRKINRTLHKEDVDLVEDAIGSKAVVAQVTRGEAIQPAGAFFNMGSVRAAFLDTATPPWLPVLRGLRARVERRCPKCAQKLMGHPEAHQMVAMLDPASSAVDGDSIVFGALDLDGPVLPVELVYLYEIERTGQPKGPETIQRVAKHAEAVAIEIQGPFGYDRKSALGHNLKDHLVDVDAEIIEVAWDKTEEKNEDLDKVAALLDGAFLGLHYNHKLRQQLISYVRANDKKIAQDYVMMLAVGAHVAWPYLPDFVTTPEEREEQVKAEAESSAYDVASAFGIEGFSFGLPDQYGIPSPEHLAEGAARSRAPLHEAGAAGLGLALAEGAARGRMSEGVSTRLAPQRGIARGA